MTTLGCLVVAAAAIGFTACAPAESSSIASGSSTGSGSSTTQNYTVTFNYNYEDATSDTASVEAGAKATKPSDPTRDLYIFEGWYTDAAGTTAYDFDTAVTADVTIYAKWKQDDAYAGKKIYTFEAECVDLSDFDGAGYSGGAQMSGAILTDWDGTGKASDGLFVSYLYVKGESTKLTFTINSSKAVDNATLILRLSGEVLETVSFNEYEWCVFLNGDLLHYGAIDISGCRTNMAESWIREFEDYTIGTNLHLNEGENTVILYTNNEEPMGGTMYATAPMVDCMKIIVDEDVDLTWDPIVNKTPHKAS
jgi:uncharacterized repeat protein (TIGR02543 family)